MTTNLPFSGAAAQVQASTKRRRHVPPTLTADAADNPLPVEAMKASVCSMNSEPLEGMSAEEIASLLQDGGMFDKAFTVRSDVSLFHLLNSIDERGQQLAGVLNLLATTTDLDEITTSVAWACCALLADLRGLNAVVAKAVQANSGGAAERASR